MLNVNYQRVPVCGPGYTWALKIGYSQNWCLTIIELIFLATVGSPLFNRQIHMESQTGIADIRPSHKIEGCWAAPGSLVDWAYAKCLGNVFESLWDHPILGMENPTTSVLCFKRPWNEGGKPNHKCPLLQETLKWGGFLHSPSFCWNNWNTIRIQTSDMLLIVAPPLGRNSWSHALPVLVISFHWKTSPPCDLLSLPGIPAQEYSVFAGWKYIPCLYIIYF